MSTYYIKCDTTTLPFTFEVVLYEVIFLLFCGICQTTLTVSQGKKCYVHSIFSYFSNESIT